MTDYQKVREEAIRKGKLPEGISSPIPIQPTTEYSLTRLITVPVLDSHRKKITGKYMRVQAIIRTPAWNSGEASAKADEIQGNFKQAAWGQGSKPWDSDGKTNWTEVEVPPDTPILELR